MYIENCSNRDSERLQQRIPDRRHLDWALVGDPRFHPGENKVRLYLWSVPQEIHREGWNVCYRHPQLSLRFIIQNIPSIAITDILTMVIYLIVWKQSIIMYGTESDDKHSASSESKHQRQFCQ